MDNLQRGPCVLPQPELDVWWVNIPAIDVAQWLQKYSDRLGEQDFERLQQTRLAKGHAQFIFTRLVVRQLLSCYHPQIHSSEWRFLRGENGRPFVDPQQSPLSFNLTHSDDKLLVVFSRHADPGIDVESWQRQVDVQPIAERYFYASEAKHLAQLAGNEAAQRQWFFRCWTLKEAAVKATGAGLSKALHKFEFGSEGNGQFWHRVHHETDQIKAATMAFWSGYCEGYSVGLACTGAGVEQLREQQPLVRQLQWPDQIGPFTIDWQYSQSKNSSTNLEP